MPRALVLAAFAAMACSDPEPPRREPTPVALTPSIPSTPGENPSILAENPVEAEPPPSAEEAPQLEVEAPSAPAPSEPEPAPSPAAASDERDDEDEPLVPPRADGTLAAGPERDSAEEAAWAALSEDGGALEASVAYRNRTFVLFTLPSADPRVGAFGETATSRVVLYLARVGRVRGAEERYVREAGVRLYDLALAGADNGCDNATVAAVSELRARDLDGDGEIEITVIAAAAATPAPSRTYNAAQECGAVAFIVGGDDLNVQARFTREYHYEWMDAGGETYLDVETTWRLGDLDGDGRADLRVTEAYRYRDTFSGDWGGDDVGTVPGHRTRAANRRSVDCPYDAATDRWICPEPPLGMQLLRTREELLRSAGPRIDRPSW